MRKIMFNNNFGLTKAVIEGRKTQTRRIATDKELSNPKTGYGLEGNETDRCFLLDGCMQIAKSAYAIGEELAIAQSYHDCIQNSLKDPYSTYDRRWMDNTDKPGYNNKLFVKADLMPHRIKITYIGIERLQDISNEDCLKEGILTYTNSRTNSILYSGDGRSKHLFPKTAFCELFNKISNQDIWSTNPYVFVYNFKLIQ